MGLFISYTPLHLPESLVLPVLLLALSSVIGSENPLAQRPSGIRCLTPGPPFATLRPYKRALSASFSGPTSRSARSDSLLV